MAYDLLKRLGITPLCEVRDDDFRSRIEREQGQRTRARRQAAIARAKKRKALDVRDVDVSDVPWIVNKEM